MYGTLTVVMLIFGIYATLRLLFEFLRLVLGRDRVPNSLPLSDYP